ncbi:AAA family ATPase [Clostridium gasigenes]|uniref:AAA family ATPase n=1 Tax=Clostridium gasigenes TaxID=94869 RepID=A0A7X0S9V6_9CLOT|nr:AAA family ATPase [Clostridium gasigenes]MBB6713679.1 AAA family ATPase [Clostridium gasigenes]
MNKRFNTTGVCVHRKHYMVDISNKLKEIKELIDNEFYFTINKPRQYGKTTTLSELNDFLKEKYLVIDISFEGIGDSVFENEKDFSAKFLKIMSKSLKFRDKEESERLSNLSKDVNDFEEASEVITEFIQGAKKEVVLFIDEVDKSSNNQLFLSFIGMLRNKYLDREVGRDYTFKSVILVGVYDVKTLKLKLRQPEESKYNSPWNIAIDFNVDMSFSEKEISTMLEEYSKYNDISMDIESISREIYFFTDGYPFLVSRLCQIIDEKINKDNKKPWTKDEVQKSVKIILEEKNTLFDSLIKNLENYEELYKYIEDILVKGIDKSYNTYNPIIELGTIHGYFKNRNGKVDVSNKIFKELIYNYMVSKLENTYSKMDGYNFKDQFIQPNGGLDIERILKRFQQFMKEQYSSKDIEFIEHHGRLLFLAFIKPIINGVGFDFKEVQVSEEKRLDLVITYNSFKYIIELKIWRGQKYNEEGIKQLCDYLDIHDLDKGYLLVFNFNKEKEFKEERLEVKGKDIFEVFV